MSLSLSKSLHDFFESRSKDERSIRSEENAPTDVEKLPRRLDDLVKSEQQTLSNDKLVEGYVVIRIEEEKSSSILPFNQYGESSGHTDNDGINEESNIVVGKSRSSVEERKRSTVDIPILVSGINVDSQITAKTSMDESNRSLVTDLVRSVDADFDDGRDGSVDGFCEFDECGVITENGAHYNQREVRPMKSIKENQRCDITADELHVHSDESLYEEKGRNIRLNSELTEDCSENGNGRDDSRLCYDNQEETEDADYKNVTDILSVECKVSIDNGNDMTSVLDSEIIADEIPAGEVINNTSQTFDAETRDCVVEHHTYLRHGNDHYDDCTNDDEGDDNDDDDNDDDDDECSYHDRDRRNEVHGKIDEDTDNSEKNSTKCENESALSVTADDDSVRSECETNETCDECTDEECEEKNTHNGRETIKTKSGRFQMVDGGTEMLFKDNDAEIILNKGTRQTMKVRKPSSLIFNRSNLTEDLIHKAQSTKIKTGTLIQTNDIPAVIHVPSGVLGDGVRPNRHVIDNEENIEGETPVTIDGISRLRQYSAELECQNAGTGHITETPRYSSIVPELGSRTHSGAATELSNLSGRNNPQAKMDSEVRDLVRKARVAQSAHLSSTKTALPPIKRDPKTTDEFRKFTKTITGDSNKMEKNTVCDVRKQIKPAVPRLLQSSVCYHDGKVDVSIYSERGLINQSDPVQLNINFVRQPQVPSKTVKNDKIETKHETKSKFQTKVLRCGMKKDRNLRRNTESTQVRRRNFGKMLSPIENPPKLENSQIICKRNKKEEQKRATHRRKKNVHPQCKKTNIWSSKFDDVDWDIVERRAQKPPFNTHLDPEASQRHMKFFMDF